VKALWRMDWCSTQSPQGIRDVAVISELFVSCWGLLTFLSLPSLAFRSQSEQILFSSSRRGFAPAILSKTLLSIVPALQNFPQYCHFGRFLAQKDQVVPCCIGRAENLATVCIPISHEFDESLDQRQLFRPITFYIFAMASSFIQWLVSRGPAASR
jgi:hypothetical protein